MPDNNLRRRRTLPVAALGFTATALLAAACGSATFNVPSTPVVSDAQVPRSYPTAPNPAAGPGWAVELDINNMIAVDSGSDPNKLIPLCNALGDDARQAVGHALSGSAVTGYRWNAVMQDLQTQSAACVTGVHNTDQPSVDEAKRQIIEDGNMLIG